MWVLLPSVPREQTLILTLGPCAARIDELSLNWTSIDRGHSGGLTLHHARGAPERIVRHLRLVDGDYEMLASAHLRTLTFTDPDRAPALRRTEATRRVTLRGSTVTLRLEDLCPSAHPPPQTSPPAH